MRFGHSTTTCIGDRRPLRAFLHCDGTGAAEDGIKQTLAAVRPQAAVDQWWFWCFRKDNRAQRWGSCGHALRSRPATTDWPPQQFGTFPIAEGDSWSHSCAAPGRSTMRAMGTRWAEAPLGRPDREGAFRGARDRLDPAGTAHLATTTARTSSTRPQPGITIVSRRTAVCKRRCPTSA